MWLWLRRPITTAPFAPPACPQSLFGTVFGTLSVFGTEKPVFKREYLGRMYSLPAFYFSRWLVQMPQHIIFPFCASCIVYWMIGAACTGVRRPCLPCKVPPRLLALFVLDGCMLPGAHPKR